MLTMFLYVTGFDVQVPAIPFENPDLIRDLLFLPVSPTDFTEKPPFTQMRRYHRMLVLVV